MTQVPNKSVLVYVMDKEELSSPHTTLVEDYKLEEKTDSTPLCTEPLMKKEDSDPELTSMNLVNIDNGKSPRLVFLPDKAPIMEPTKFKSASPNAEKLEGKEVSPVTNSMYLNAKGVEDENEPIKIVSALEKDETHSQEEHTNSYSASPKAGKVEDHEFSIIEASISTNSNKLRNVTEDEKKDGVSELHENMDERADLESMRSVESTGKLEEDRDFKVKAKEATEYIREDGYKEDLQEQPREENLCDVKEPEPVFDGTEIPGMEANHSQSLDYQSNNWPGKAVALKNFVREKSIGAVSTMIRHLSWKRGDIGDINEENNKEVADSNREGGAQEGSEKVCEKTSWNPLSYFKFFRDANDLEGKVEQEGIVGDLTLPIPMKGRVMLYTRLGCQDCREARLFLYRKRLRYVEINIDVYPSRKLELEKISGSPSVPKVFFNEVLIGGLREMSMLEDNGKLKDKLDYLIAEAPSPEAPLPPLSGEDDMSNSGSIDELVIIVKKMKESVIVKDRFYKMRWFTNCFVGSEAVDFISEDQYLEREEAVEFGRGLASKLFFHHILDENVFEDGNHFYRFLDHDPIVSTQCYNIPRGIIEIKPKPITDIASRLRFLSYAIFDAYTSEDGRHVDYRSIHGSEEFARYLRIVEELQRVEMQDMSREEKLAFFVNLYNMMAIHAILVWGHPVGPLERRKLFGDFKYVIAGFTYSLSAIQNGILRGNQRPPYNLMKPFSAKDKRVKVILPYPEPLVHFALVCGTRSGPALRCYSPGNIDRELMDAARDFLRSGGIVFDFIANAASVSKILKWFSSDFGKNEIEVLKHASNYLESADSEALLELLSNSQLKVTYQPYDWGLNC
ncbi:hypothetical protein SAY86_021980 [Trapa natans]|uniref:DEP domain-containing protein n=1 Tax=Trapa natans TaxID=22666 RepID=A0AAN7M2W4_TRANT|nr:hypothetical protein SAY86_021980 [Trapa natans]